MTRQFDVVVLGATSLTAREVCRYLTVRVDELGMSWAGAGRDPQRVRSALDRAGADGTEVMQADVGDMASLRRLASRSRVVLNLVGPYAPTALPVVEACIGEGTHYLDLTGELTFVRDLAERVGDAALAAGVKVVQPCGFEALPFDLLFGLALDAADAEVTAFDVEFSIQRLPRGLRPSDAVSGGTVQSLAGLIDDDDATQNFDPALLVRDLDRARRVRQVSPLRFRPRRSITGGALAPLVPAPTINPPVIHRSAELLDVPVLRYREGIRVLDGAVTLPVGAAAATAAAVTFSSVRAASRAPMAVRRRFARGLARTLPGAGSGPAEDRVADWRWQLSGRATTRAGSTIDGSVVGHGHPGYRTTAHMLAEAGLIIAADHGLPDRKGLLTPLAALGTSALDRFARAGLKFGPAILTRDGQAAWG